MQHKSNFEIKLVSAAMCEVSEVKEEMTLKASFLFLRHCWIRLVRLGLPIKANINKGKALIDF